MQGRMTAEQAEALAGFLVTLRPGQRAWTKTATFDALRDAAARHTADPETLARAAIRAALTAKIATPAVIAMTGAHWETIDAGPAPQPPRAHRCERCGSIHADNAPCSTRPSANTAAHIARVKTLMDGITANHCRHHVRLDLCHECQETA